MNGDFYDDDEEETIVTTTTTTTTGEYPTVTKFRERGKWYVIDPANRTKTVVNDGDDMYEDAAGFVWRII